MVKMRFHEWPRPVKKVIIAAALTLVALSYLSLFSWLAIVAAYLL